MDYLSNWKVDDILQVSEDNISWEDYHTIQNYFDAVQAFQRVEDNRTSYPMHWLYSYPGYFRIVRNNGELIVVHS